MRAWQTEEMSSEYQSRRDISKESSEQRRKLKKAVHVARQELARARKLRKAIDSGIRYLRDLSHKSWQMLEDLRSGKVAGAQDECDKAVGWNQQATLQVGFTGNGETARRGAA